MAANAIVIASTFRRTRVSPGSSAVEGPVTGVEIGIGEHAEYEGREIGVNGRFCSSMPDTRPIVLVTESEYRKGEECFVAASGPRVPARRR